MKIRYSDYELFKAEALEHVTLASSYYHWIMETIPKESNKRIRKRLNYHPEDVQE